MKGVYEKMLAERKEKKTFHVTNATFTSLTDLSRQSATHALSDTGAEGKTMVAGHHWVNAFLEARKEYDAPRVTRKATNQHTYKFGAGQRGTLRTLRVPIKWKGSWQTVQLDVVHGNLPCLLGYGLQADLGLVTIPSRDKLYRIDPAGTSNILSEVKSTKIGGLIGLDLLGGDLTIAGAGNGGGEYSGGSPGTTKDTWVTGQALLVETTAEKVGGAGHPASAGRLPDTAGAGPNLEKSDPASQGNSVLAEQAPPGRVTEIPDSAAGLGAAATGGSPTEGESAAATGGSSTEPGGAEVQEVAALRMLTDSEAQNPDLVDLDAIEEEATQGSDSDTREETGRIRAASPTGKRKKKSQTTSGPVETGGEEENAQTTRKTVVKSDHPLLQLSQSECKKLHNAGHLPAMRLMSYLEASVPLKTRPLTPEERKELMLRIDTVVDACGGCQKQGAKPMAPGAKLSEIADAPFNSHVVADLVMLRSGIWVLSVACRSTKYKMYAALTDSRAYTVARIFMRDWVRHFGMPRDISLPDDQERGSALHDRGSEFIGADFLTALESLGALTNGTPAYSPQSHGQVERANRSLLESLRDSRATTVNETDVVLSTSSNVLNNTLTVGGFTPAQLVFGRSTTMHRNVFDDTPESALVLQRATAPMQRLLMLQDDARAHVTQFVHARKVRQVLAQAIRPQPLDFTQLKHGEYLLYWRPRTEKAGPAWRGPARFVGHTPHCVYLDHGGAHVSAHPTAVRLAKGDLRPPDAPMPQEEPGYEELDDRDRQHGIADAGGGDFGHGGGVSFAPPPPPAPKRRARSLPPAVNPAGSPAKKRVVFESDSSLSAVPASTEAVAGSVSEEPAVVGDVFEPEPLASIPTAPEVEVIRAPGGRRYFRSHMTRKHRGAFFVCREQSRRFPVVRALVRGAGPRFPGAFVVFVYFYPRAAARGRGGLKVFFLVLGCCCPTVAQFSVFSFQAHFSNFRRALLCCKVAKFPAFRIFEFPLFICRIPETSSLRSE